MTEETRTRRQQLIEAGQAHAKTGSGRRIRRAARRTLADVAEELGVTPTTVSNWERAAVIPYKNNAAAWATLLAKWRIEVLEAVS